MQILLIVLFVIFVLIGVPISYALGFVSFAGIAALPIIPNSVVFTKMFNGLNSFTLLAVPLFILAANLMNEGSISDRLIDVCKSSVGHVRGGLAHATILVSMVFAGISGSSQADTAGIGKILIPAMEKQGFDKGTAVGVTAASSTLGSIIPPSITMVVYAGIANVGTGALFMTGLIPGIMLGLAMMLVVVLYSKKKNFPKGEKVPTKEVLKQIWTSLPALLTPIILIGGIVSGLFTPTEMRRCGLAAPETLEHLIALLFRNAHTGIRNIHTGIELPWTDADPDTAACRRVLDRVIQNIAQCLRRPPGVMPGRDAVVAFHRQLNLLHLRPGPDRIQRLRDCVIQACALYMQGKSSCLQPRHLDQGLQQKVQLVDLTGHRVHELPALPGA